MTDYDSAWAKLVPILESVKDRAPTGRERLLLGPSLSVKFAADRFLRHLELKGNEQVKDFFFCYGNLPATVLTELNSQLDARGLRLKPRRGQWYRFKASGNNWFGWQDGWSEFAHVLKKMQTRLGFLQVSGETQKKGGLSARILVGGAGLGGQNADL